LTIERFTQSGTDDCGADILCATQDRSALLCWLLPLKEIAGADLLERRPDVANAERSTASASAQIGVAKAAYYPQFSLTGFAGYESSNPASLLNWQNSIASLMGSAVAPLFTGGRLHANLDQAEATYRQSVLQYEKSVLVAYADVEDQLAAIHYLARQSLAEGGLNRSLQHHLI
jgi:outer membrane protein TolC